MNAVIVNFRTARHHQTGNQAVLKIDSVADKDAAEKLVGKKVSFACEGKDKKVIAGKISAAHGNSGAVRALFECGLPGQAIGKTVKVE
ncbi:MAG: 50S ribosomal protein L35ae [Nanoarchaeota archaeon]